MPVNVSAALRDGVPFDCLLSECLRTAIYRVPQFFAAAGEEFSHVVLNADDFRSGVTTDPEEYLAQNDLAGQFANDPAWRAWVRDCCNSDSGKSATKLHVVLQVRQELSAWPATDGQCWKADLGLGDHLLFVDGGEHPVPPFDDKPHWRNAVLAAVRIKLDATGSFEKIGDQVSYRTTDDRWLDLLRLSVSSPDVSRSSPLATEELREKARGIAALVSQIRAQVDSVGADPAPLRQLLDALQLAPLTDDAYRRLWFLRLHDRCRRFLHGCGLKIEEEQAFKKVNTHRNAIAHEGIERIDLRLLEELQQNVYEVIRRNPSRGGQKS